jgi:hypothetical protein
VELSWEVRVQKEANVTEYRNTGNVKLLKRPRKRANGKTCSFRTRQDLIVTTYEYSHCTKRSNLLRARYQIKKLSKLILYETREVAALLEMALWKSQIRQAMPISSSNGIDAKDRQNCRVACKAEFFIRNTYYKSVVNKI